MSQSKTIKELVTESVLKELSAIDDVYRDLPIDSVMVKWWQTGHMPEGLRLTSDGMKAFKAANIAHYDYAFIPKNLNFYSHILELSKKIKCPYYVGMGDPNHRTPTNKTGSFLRVYDGKVATMISLYGDVQSYLDSIKKVRK